MQKVVFKFLAYGEIVKNKELKTGWRVQPSFQIGLHEKDKALLELIRSSLGVGQIYKHSKDSFQYEVQTFKELEVIISHFDKYPLITQKRTDFELFKSFRRRRPMELIPAPHL